MREKGTTVTAGTRGGDTGTGGVNASATLGHLESGVLMWIWGRKTNTDNDNDKQQLQPQCWFHSGGCTNDTNHMKVEMG